MDTAYACKYGRDGRCVEIDLRFNRTAQDLENSSGCMSKKTVQF